MIIISHRGNVDGPDPSKENTIKQIDKVISMGIPVEIDVRVVDDKWFLGHDYGEYQIDKSYLLQNKEMLWCHAKNISAFEKMLAIGLHCFWHQEDHYTLTSKGIIWAYPNQYVEKGILVMPSKEFLNSMKKPVYGICVDNVKDFLDEKNSMFI
jgi:hypothetical protein